MFAKSIDGCKRLIVPYMEEDPTILHCDLNGFFASVEALSHPEVGNRPMAVSGNPDNRHGIILAKNEAAKAFGIKTAETIWQAKRKCPQLILIRASRGKYEFYSQKVNDIYSRFTDRVEPFGIDESWLDVTHSRKLFGDGKAIADKIRALVKSELGLTVSVGVSFNKTFAKLASDMKKPDATTVVMRSDLEDKVYPLDVSALLYVGKNTAAALARMNIRTIGALAAADRRALIRAFGKFGGDLSDRARGLENEPVEYFGHVDEVKSVGNSITFARDLKSPSDVKTGFMRVAEKVCARLKRKNFKCSVLQITIKSASFQTITRQGAFEEPTRLRTDLVSKAMELFDSAWDASEIPVRMLGLSACSLSDSSSPVQGRLDFSSASKDGIADLKKQQNAQDAFFNVREKFGSGSIKFGSMMDGDLLE